MSEFVAVVESTGRIIIFGVTKLVSIKLQAKLELTSL